MQANNGTLNRLRACSLCVFRVPVLTPLDGAPTREYDGTLIEGETP